MGQGPPAERVSEKLRAASWPAFHLSSLAVRFVEEIDVRGGSALMGFEALSEGARSTRFHTAFAAHAGTPDLSTSPPVVRRERPGTRSGTR